MAVQPKVSNDSPQRQKRKYPPINVKHAKRLDPILPQNPLLLDIHIPQPNIHQLLDTDPMLIPQPPKHLLLVVLPRQARQKRHRHAMHVPTVARLGGIDIGMRIHPNHRNVPSKPLPHRACRPGNRANRNTVIPAQRQHQPALLGLRMHLLCDLPGDRRHGARVLHAAVRRVLGRDEVRVEVHGIVAVQVVAELVAQLGQQARLDEGGGRGVDAGLALAAGEADGDDAEVFGVGEEFGLDHGGVHFAEAARGAVLVGGFGGG